MLATTVEKLDECCKSDKAEIVEHGGHICMDKEPNENTSFLSDVPINVERDPGKILVARL